MAIVDTTSTNSAVQDLFNTQGQHCHTTMSRAPPPAATGNQSLGKDAFLQLLVTQLKNQNPLSPQDNGAFVAQLAQFSSLEGINTLNDSVNCISSNFSSSQALQASSLVGRSIITQTDKALVDTSKSMTGSVAVTAATGNVSIKITDKDGNVVRTIDMGAQSAGTSDFIWDGKNDDGRGGSGRAPTPSRPPPRMTRATQWPWPLRCRPRSPA